MDHHHDSVPEMDPVPMVIDPINETTHPVTAAPASSTTANLLPINTSINNNPPKLHESLVSRNDISLPELISLMDEYPPLVPDAVTDYYLSKAGFDCDDIKIKRVLGLAAQKFIADVANDALHFSRLRQQPSQTHARKGPKKLVLNLEDLSAALSEYGINVKRPEYFT